MFSSTIILLFGVHGGKTTSKDISCRQFTRNSFCTGQAGIKAAETSAEFMVANIERKEALEKKFVKKVERNLASWGSEMTDDEVLNQKKLKEALKEGERLREKKDDRKSKYNVTYSNDVTRKWKRTG